MVKLKLSVQLDVIGQENFAHDGRPIEKLNLVPILPKQHFSEESIVTTKAYLVSWLGKGQIVWEPLEQATLSNYSLAQVAVSPARHALNVLAENSVSASTIQSLIDPVMSKLSDIESIVSITAGLSALSAGLSIANLVQSFRMTAQLADLDRKMAAISGKFDLHFLDQSLDFFLSNHAHSKGLIASVANALEADCYNALQALVGHKDLQIPAYLNLKITSQAKAIESWNRFQYSVLHNGALPVISQERIATWLKSGEGHQRLMPSGGYAPQELILQAVSHLQQVETKSMSKITSVFASGGSTLMDRAISPENFARASSVVLLARELQAAQTLSESLEDKIVATPNKAMMVKAS